MMTAFCGTRNGKSFDSKLTVVLHPTLGLPQIMALLGRRRFCAWEPGAMTAKTTTTVNATTANLSLLFIDSSSIRILQSAICNLKSYGGEGGIRTHGTVSRSQHFQCCQFNHSCTSPELPIADFQSPIFKSAIGNWKSAMIWRRGWDSNPRWALTHSGFRDRCTNPLCDLSASYSVLLLRKNSCMSARHSGSNTPAL